jgi:hypothetical protein
LTLAAIFTFAATATALAGVDESRKYIKTEEKREGEASALSLLAQRSFATSPRCGGLQHLFGINQ